jgi:uncharacterized membrane protein
MDTLFTLLAQRPVVAAHVASAVGALVLGAVLLTGRKGRTAHRVLGWGWVGLMAVAVVTSAFIHESSMPNLAGYSPIHLLTVFTAVALVGAVRAARRHQVSTHRKAMTQLYWGACIVAGAFTLLPGRLLGGWLWHDMLGWAA